MAAVPAAMAVNGVIWGTTSQAYLGGKAVNDTKGLISELCRQFYNLGWVSGNGDSITIKVHDDSIPKPQQLVLMSASCVQKERMVPEDMYVLIPNGFVLSSPSPKPYPNKPPKCSDCGPLFMKNIAKRRLVSWGKRSRNLKCKIEAYQKMTAVLVHNLGIYIWGDSWISAKTQAECYHYFFAAAIKLHQLGLNRSTANHGPILKRNISAKAGTVASNRESEPSRRCIVLDIEGTTTPISFVTDVLFPYAHDNVGRHLCATYDMPETQDDIKLLRSQVQDDLEKGVIGAIPVPSDDAGKDAVIAALVDNVEAMIKADRKITALKQLQGHIWRTGFENNELEGVVFEDVPEAFKKWHELGIKVYIYSSGSRLAQRLIFGNTNHGDLRKYLSGFFDTTVGNKREARSYIEITESVGVDKPSEILFVTDVFQEAIVAKAAGLEVIVSIRPGNGPLPDNHGFRTINSFMEI